MVVVDEKKGGGVDVEKKDDDDGGVGYTVAHNKPYAGGFITEHYGRPARHLHALQIEVNRGLYMNERTFQKSAGFDALADDMARFSADLMAMPDHHFIDLPLAAE